MKTKTFKIGRRALEFHRVPRGQRRPGTLGVFRTSRGRAYVVIRAQGLDKVSTAGARRARPEASARNGNAPKKRRARIPAKPTKCETYSPTGVRCVRPPHHKGRHTFVREGKR
jgi:hypothetical protein